jgi:hypothetical protein
MYREDKTIDEGVLHFDSDATFQYFVNWPEVLAPLIKVLEEIRDRLPEKGRDDGQD